ncbi:uncharacterized protein CDAR_252081 [Caerostris darwini]|uniref:LAGLIDADG homing endonuclease n=1 Tax=Caerostris darwini TaxID=1538125 RepID=A0AAV4N533_9ARAC|nr:uncharacterized protein CDAR_252081 [Caerostris darwini]
MTSETLNKYKISGTLPHCTYGIQNKPLKKNTTDTSIRYNEKIGRTILLESLSKTCPDYAQRKDEKDSEYLCYLCMHEITSSNPIRRHNVVPGYTGYIPGRPFTCGDRFTLDCKRCTEKFLRRSNIYEEAMQNLTHSLKDLPPYFEVWYEIPRGKTRNNLLCH